MIRFNFMFNKFFPNVLLFMRRQGKIWYSQTRGYMVQPDTGIYGTTRNGVIYVTARHGDIWYSQTRGYMVQPDTGIHGTTRHGDTWYSQTRGCMLQPDAGIYGTARHGDIWYSQTRGYMVQPDTGIYGKARHATDDSVIRHEKRCDLNAGWLKQDAETRSWYSSSSPSSKD